MLQLKTLTLKSRVISSPMAACTDLAYRLLSREHGLEFCFLEMVAAESLVRRNKGTADLMKTVPEDRPLGAQIVGCRPEAMGEAAMMVEAMGYDLIDLNLGCPVPKIAGQGAGSALLNRPDDCRKIFTAVVKKVKRIPVTVKMRLGVNDGSGREAAQIARIAEECGIDAIAVHGRTRAQGYSGSADYHAIRRVKEAVALPVFGNGDVLCGEDAKRLLEITGCDGVMIGRGGLGNPWVFKSVESVLAGGAPVPEAGLEEKRAALLRHFSLELEHRDERTALLHMRRIACWYFKNMPGAAEFRGAINTAEDVPTVRRLIEEFGKGARTPDGA
jgi:tRNA-dihydrouridine synthase B